MKKKPVDDITTKLSSLLSSKKIITKRNTKKDKEKLFDSEKKKIKKCLDENELDVDQKTTSDEYASDNIEDEHDNE